MMQYGQGKNSVLSNTIIAKYGIAKYKINMPF